MVKEVSREDVLNANVYIHTALIDLYDDQPHFRPENKAKVTAILEELRQRAAAVVDGRSKLLDMGCGTGFLLKLAEPIFDELTGVDITPAMLERIDVASGKIKLHCGPVEDTPFADGTFDLVTAYSFMDHLYDLKPFLREVFRVLKPGGVFYADQNANREFWDRVGALPGDPAGYSGIVSREMTAGLKSEEEFAKKRDIDVEAFRTAEYIKTRENGLAADEVLAIAREVGFRECAVRRDWYIGQGKVLHGQPKGDAEVIEAFLREASPLTDHLFKYLRFDFVK